MSRCPQGLWAFRLQIPSGPNPIPVQTRRFPLASPCSWLAKRRKIQQMQLPSPITPKPAGMRLLNNRGGCHPRTLPYPAEDLPLAPLLTRTCNGKSEHRWWINTGI